MKIDPPYVTVTIDDGSPNRLASPDGEDPPTWKVV